MQQNGSRKNNPNRKQAHTHKKGCFEQQAIQYKRAWRIAECARKISALKKVAEHKDGKAMFIIAKVET